jgi:hypothetical protein
MSSPAYLEAKGRREALLAARTQRAVELGAARVTQAQARAVAASSDRLQRIRAAFAESMAAAAARREVRVNVGGPGGSDHHGAPPSLASPCKVHMGRCNRGIVPAPGGYVPRSNALLTTLFSLVGRHTLSNGSLHPARETGSGLSASGYAEFLLPPHRPLSPSLSVRPPPFNPRPYPMPCSCHPSPHLSQSIWFAMQFRMRCYTYYIGSSTTESAVLLLLPVQWHRASDAALPLS